MTSSILNGELVNSDAPTSLQINRSFLYGDGFFETMRFVNQKIVFEEDHWRRIRKSIELLKLNTETIPDREKLIDEIKLLVEANKITSSARVRLTLFRNADGFYIPQNNQSGYFLSCFPLVDKRDNYLEGIRVGIYQDQKKIAGKLSHLKSTSAQLYVMAGIYARENNFDDVLILNQNGNCIESVSCNLFLVKDKTLLTPPISEGCVDGVFRKNILRAANELGIQAHESIITQMDLADAEEIFLSNVIRGIQTIKKMDEGTYANSITKKISDYFTKLYR